MDSLSCKGSNVPSKRKAQLRRGDELHVAEIPGRDLEQSRVGSCRRQSRKLEDVYEEIDQTDHGVVEGRPALGQKGLAPSSCRLYLPLNGSAGNLEASCNNDDVPCGLGNLVGAVYQLILTDGTPAVAKDSAVNPGIGKNGVCGHEATVVEVMQEDGLEMLSIVRDLE